MGTEDFLAGPWSLGHWAVCGPLIPADQPLGFGVGGFMAGPGGGEPGPAGQDFGCRGASSAGLLGGSIWGSPR